jgi:hypothetical protein
MFQINLNAPAFNKSNLVYKGLIKVLKSEGLAAVKHYSKISDEEIAIIIETLSPDDPQQL